MDGCVLRENGKQMDKSIFDVTVFIAFFAKSFLGVEEEEMSITGVDPENWCSGVWGDDLMELVEGLRNLLKLISWRVLTWGEMRRGGWELSQKLMNISIF